MICNFHDEHDDERRVRIIYFHLLVTDAEITNHFYRFAVVHDIFLHGLCNVTSFAQKSGVVRSHRLQNFFVQNSVPKFVKEHSLTRLRQRKSACQFVEPFQPSVLVDDHDGLRNIFHGVMHYLFAAGYHIFAVLLKFFHPVFLPFAGKQSEYKPDDENYRRKITIVL